MKKLIHFFENHFKILAAHSSVKTEINAGVTSFLTMAYILLVNPSILGSVGMDPGAAFVATCLASALGCLLMGLMANYPIAVAPSMALNAYFAYVIVGGLGYSWQHALGAVFLAGILFLLMTVLGARQWIIRAIPESLHIGVCAGIGLFIGMLAFKSAGIVVASPQTLVSLGPITSLPAILFLLGFCLIVGLDHLRVPGAIIIGILATTLLGLFTGQTVFHGFMAAPPSLSATWLQFDIHGLWEGNGPAIVFSFFLVALFDAAGTLVGVLQEPLFKNDPHRSLRMSRALAADSIATIAGAALGTSTLAPYIESSAGIRAGGRTGLTSLVVAGFFILALFFSPLADTIPSFATAPALLFVACLMIKSLVHVDWDDLSECIPSMVTFLMIPFSFSIADGIGLGFISYCLIKIFCGKFKDLNPMLVGLSVVFILYFVYRPQVV